MNTVKPHPVFSRFPTTLRRAASTALAACVASWLGTAVAPERSALACASAWWARGGPVAVNEEVALIVWDEKHHLEHFVRTADFRTESKSFGFLVPTPSRPTPSRPTLGEVEDAGTLFCQLHDDAATRTQFDTAWGLNGFDIKLGDTFRFGADPGPGAPRPSGAVLEQKRVAGLDATVLAADDSAGLAEWLGAHGFELRAALRRWLDEYAGKGFYIVAFRYEKPAAPAGEEADGLGSKAVRLTFSTEHPFYPYREPEDAPVRPGRQLRLFVIAEERAAPPGDWYGAEVLSDRIPELKVPSLSQGLDLPKHPWLTAFVDRSEKRAPVDLRFFPVATTTRLLPATAIVTVPLTIELPIAAVLFGVLLSVGTLAWWGVRRARRRKMAGSSSAAAATPVEGQA